jgi:hypothetical protein
MDFEKFIRDRYQDIMYVAVLLLAAGLGYVFFDDIYQSLFLKTDYLNLLDRDMYLAFAGCLVLGLVLARLSKKLADLAPAGPGLGLLIACYLYVGKLINVGGFGDADIDPMLPFLQAGLGLFALFIAITTGYNVLKKYTTKDISSPTPLQNAGLAVSQPIISAQAAQTSAPVTQVEKIIHEKETIREIVKIPCAYCGTLIEITAARCPNCGAPLKK